ncbi:beta-alanine-activating enzyme isoform X1 [Diorhabda sublineata]|uniref:beta-alanine-activating enzyme isoform X1 n=1 Tax=Diorhabda sublineata TaxID=1163346 RepID=UPI0024E0D33E|nr:beta-alanine-activating enzyme isoform X1 [Diorhabda sublineata]
MSTLINKFFAKKSDKIGIIMYNKDQIISKTFKEMYEIAETLFGEFEKILINCYHKCIGLMMEKNIYLPSIILSLHKLHCAFTYVSSKDLVKGTDNLELEYVLSFETIGNENFKKMYEINIDNDKMMFIWKNITIQRSEAFRNDIFCIMKSSGTTGNNKIIGIPYSCIERNTSSLINVFNITSSDIIFWGTPLSFDPSLIEMLMGLLNGATIAMVAHHIYINPEVLFDILFNTTHITVLQMVPSVFLRWNDMVIEKIFSNTKLRILALGGEVFPKRVLEFKRQDSLRLFNLYGVTELSCWATVHEITDETVGDDVPIGTCLDDTIIKVYDENNLEINNGLGEAIIGSQSRKCYINNELTKTDVPNFRKTGDIILIKNGNFFYKGRKDKVVKRFGHKIGLAEIEETIFTHCSLVSKCIWSNKYNKILTFVLLKEMQSKHTRDRILEKIRNKLLHILSEASFPDYFDLLQNFPLTPHGKVDENKLENFYAMSLDNLEYDVHKIFKDLWCKYLGLDTKHLNFLKNHSFFELGGKSITAIQLIQEFKDLTNAEYVDDLTEALLHDTFSNCEEIVKRFGRRNILKRTMDDDSEREKIKQLKKEISQVTVLWKYNLKACVDATPLIFKDNNNDVRIAVGSFCNLFAVLDESGKELFKEVLSGSIGSTPTVSPCRTYLYIGCFDGTLHCINFEDKQIVWQFKTKDKIQSTPVFCNDGTSIIVGSYDKHVYNLCVENGSIIWKTGVDGCVCSNILIDNDCVFATTTFGSCYCLSECKGYVKWKFTCDSPIFGTPCLLSKYQQILVPSVLGVIFCLSSGNGDLIWKFEINSNLFSSLVCFQNTVVFGCHDKNIYILEVCGDTYKSVKSFSTDSKISSTPLIYHNNDVTVVVGISNKGTIYFIDFETLVLLKKGSLPEEVFSSPVQYQNNIYVGCRDNNLYCLTF